MRQRAARDTRGSDDGGNCVQAKRIIEEEHRSLAAVLHGMLYVVREIRYVGIEPDFVLRQARRGSAAEVCAGRHGY